MDNNIKCAIAHFDKKVTDYQIYVDRALQDQDKEIKAIEKQQNEFFDENNKGGVFASAIKGTATGSGSVVIDDVSPVEHDIKVMVESKNIIPYPFSEKTKTGNGITFTDNGDGSVTATGTTSTSYYFSFVNQANNLNLPQGKYFFKATPKKGTYQTLYAYVTCKTLSGATVEVTDFGDGVVLDLTEDATATISCVVASGHDGSELVFKPILSKGKTPTDWTPYVKDFSGKEVVVNGVSLVVNSDGTTENVTSANPTTITTSNDVCINAEYVVDTKKYIDRKLAELVSRQEV